MIDQMRSILEIIGNFLLIIAFLGFVGYGLTQIYAGFLGIDFHLGKVWAIGAIILAFLFRFTLPLTIGSFFGAMNVWGWHWAGALLFAAPGLIFMGLMVPEILATTFAWVFKKQLK